MDYQDAKLLKFLEGTGVQVIRVGNDITLSMPRNITFRTDRDVLSPDFLTIMHSVTLVLNEYDKTMIEVMGYTDSSGSDDDNLALSQMRARFVASHLYSEGVNPERVLAQGFGAQFPIAPNTTAEGRGLNRRVALRLSPLTQP
jgi:outer membrane protein OmpA-like peptidoglycan-associated protein